MSHTADANITRKQLIDLLNEDLSREYQAIIAYVNYSQVIKGAQYMHIAQELAVHAAEELAHALTIAGQIDYLGGMPTVTPQIVKTSEKPEDMLRFDLDNENTTIAKAVLRAKSEEHTFGTGSKGRSVKQNVVIDGRKAFLSVTLVFSDTVVKAEAPANA